jgi:hypothetical protein
LLNDLYCSPNNYSGNKIENNEMGGACSMSVGEERRIKGYGGENLRKETSWETKE